MTKAKLATVTTKAAKGASTKSPTLLLDGLQRMYTCLFGLPQDQGDGEDC